MRFLSRSKRKESFSLSAMSEQMQLRGSIVGLWAGMESAIDRSNHAALVVSGGQIATKLPRNFSEKLLLFREIPLHVAEFEEFRDAGNELADRVLSRIEDRHFLVHGYTLPSEPGANTLRLRKHRLQRMTIDDEDREYTLEELRALNKESLALSNDWADFINCLAAKLIAIS